MNWEQKNLLSDIELIKSKIDDVLTTHVWHGEDMYKKNELTTKEERMLYAYGYEENRIQHEQTTDLLTMYLKQLDESLVKFKLLEQEKASRENFGEESRNA